MHTITHSYILRRSKPLDIIKDPYEDCTSGHSRKWIKKLDGCSEKNGLQKMFMVMHIQGGDLTKALEELHRTHITQSMVFLLAKDMTVFTYRFETDRLCRHRPIQL
jgi:hypothetical protein